MAGKRGNGEGLIRKHKDGLWEARVMINYTTRSVYAKTQQEALEKRDKLLSEVKSGTHTNCTMTVGAWLDTWLAEYKLGIVKDKTYQGYECNVRKHLKPAFDKIKLKNLEADDIQRVVNRKTRDGLAKSTVLSIKRTIHCALEEAVGIGLLGRNVASGVKIHNDKQKEARVLTAQEQQLLLKASKGERLGFAIEFALFTGLRAGELFGLRWYDVDMEERTITIRQTVQRLKGVDEKSSLRFDTPKSKAGRRTIPLLKEIASKLQKHHAKQLKERELAGSSWVEHDLVFTTEFGMPVDPRNFQRVLSRVVDKAGIPHVNIHALRHAFSTRAGEIGVKIDVVSKAMGHSDVRLTAKTYTHTLSEHMKNEMNKMEKLLRKGGKA